VSFGTKIARQPRLANTRRDGVSHFVHNLVDLIVRWNETTGAFVLDEAHLFTTSTWVLLHAPQQQQPRLAA
jgi:hypothetical protein